MFCRACQTNKSTEDFYVSNTVKCKECIKSSVRENRLNKIEYYREFDRMRASMPHRVAARVEYQKSSAYAESHEAAAKRWASRNAAKRAAHIAVGNAVRDGRLTPWPTCSVPTCDKKPEAHRPDYSSPLDVVWLCPSHHKAAHAAMKTKNQE